MRDNVVLGVLVLVVLLFTALEGNIVAGVAFVAFLLVPYGFGRLLWSTHARTEWCGWLLMAVGIAILLYLQASTLAMFAALAVSAQVIARLLGKYFHQK